MYLKIVIKNDAKKVSTTVIKTTNAPIATPGPAYACAGCVIINEKRKVKIK